MASSLHNLIIAGSIALTSLLPIGSTVGQINYVPQVSTYSANNQGYGGSIIDHSSMSPDNWSTPETVSAPVASIASNGVLSNTVQPNTTPASRPIAPYQPSSNKTLIPPAVQQSYSSPSIPDLNATATRHPLDQIRSLIRQPGNDTQNSVLAGALSTPGQSPLPQSNYGTGGQTGLPLSGSSSRVLSNTSLPALSRQPALQEKIISATGKFDIDPATNPAIRSLPATRSPLTSPITSSPAFGQPRLQVTPGRYPLGINGSPPITPTTNPPVAGNPSPTTYNGLISETGGPQLGSSSYPSVGVSSPAISQPLFQQQSLASSPVFRPDLGHRDPNPTFRGRDHDSGLKMDFEDKKKEYPGLGEILATGRYFGSVSVEYLETAFQNNSAITQLNSTAGRASFARSESFDFDFETAPRLRFGFESKFGPGVELDYFQYDQRSNVSSFTSNGLNSGQLSTGLFGPSSLTTLEAANAGETLAATHGIDIETFSIMFFKEIKFPISRLNGTFGFQYASIFQTLEGRLTNATGDVIGSLRSTSDFRAYGPKFRLEYYRPIGHTKLEFITKVGGGVLFGERDQIVSNTGSPAVNRFGSDELAITGDFYGGVQYKQNTAENRAYYIRLGVTHQTWIGGGTAVDAQETFGLRGFAFEVGFNR